MNFHASSRGQPSDADGPLILSRSVRTREGSLCAPQRYAVVLGRWIYYLGLLRGWCLSLGFAPRLDRVGHIGKYVPDAHFRDRPGIRSTAYNFGFGGFGRGCGVLRYLQPSHFGAWKIMARRFPQLAAPDWPPTGPVWEAGSTRLSRAMSNRTLSKLLTPNPFVRVHAKSGSLEGTHPTGQTPITSTSLEAHPIGIK